MFEKTEYVNPKEGYCTECKCSFGVHLVTCSKFVPQCKAHGITNCKRCSVAQESTE